MDDSHRLSLSPESDEISDRVPTPHPKQPPTEKPKRKVTIAEEDINMDEQKERPPISRIDTDIDNMDQMPARLRADIFQRLMGMVRFSSSLTTGQSIIVLPLTSESRSSGPTKKAICPPSAP
jgi:hypothetical protein